MFKKALTILCPQKHSHYHVHKSCPADLPIRVGWKLKKCINEKNTMWFPFSYVCRTEKYNYFPILRYFSYRGRNIKMVKMAKYGHFEYVVEYLIWVSIKRYWTCKLALACQNWIYCIRLKENIQKPSKTECFRIQLLYFSVLHI